MPVIVDDHLLSALLTDRGVLPPTLRAKRRRREVFTTGHWYYRLCRATRSRRVTGALSGPLADLPEPELREAVAAIVRLPDEIGLLSLRDLSPIMADLSERHRLNVLALEALAAALHLDADVHVSAVDAGPQLRMALEREGRRMTEWRLP